MDSKFSISIIIPVHNEEKRILQCDSQKRIPQKSCKYKRRFILHTARCIRYSAEFKKQKNEYINLSRRVFMGYAVNIPSRSHFTFHRMDLPAAEGIALGNLRISKDCFE